MLSLSIFSSSQRISVALYEEFVLKMYVEKKLTDNKIDSIFLLLREVFQKSTKKIDKIFYSTGPGSFTAIRSIKAIAQGISAATNAQIITLTDFDIYLAQLKIKKSNVVVFFENFNKKYFYQHFKLEKDIYKQKSKIIYGDFSNAIKFILEKKKNKKGLILISNSKKKKLCSFKENEIFTYKLCAKKIAEAIFSGYGSVEQKIFYHHTYYE